MSKIELDRFQSDLKTKPALAQLVRDGGFGLGSIAEVAKTEGYEFDLTELKSYVSEQSSGVLSDEQLAAVAAAGSTWTVTSTVAYAWAAAAGAVVVVGVAVFT